LKNHKELHIVYTYSTEVPDETLKVHGISSNEKDVEKLKRKAAIKILDQVEDLEDLEEDELQAKIDDFEELTGDELESRCVPILI
jgi:hypothetical protein